MKIKQGDIVYGNCVDHPYVPYHVGIVYDDGKNKFIYHNTPDLLNKYGGNVVATSYDKFMEGRVLKQIRRSNVSNEEILKVARKCATEQYDSMFFNCEDFILEITDGKRRSDVRDAYKIVFLTAVILFLL
jgi:hypothetical protein